ncbi:MAG: ribosome silencing factor [Pseudomonadota bacterium]|jgi:ribosome-associated protein
MSITIETQELSKIIINALEDVKAKEITVIDTQNMTKMFDQVIIASGTSNTQTKALAHRVSQHVKQSGGTVQSIEGLDTGEWVLVDCIDIVVHIMLPPIRAYYNIEGVWAKNKS